MKKISSPFKQSTRKATTKTKTIKSPFSQKQVLRVSRYGEIYRDGDKIYFKAYHAKYPKLLAILEEFMGERVLSIKDRGKDGNGYKFNAWLMENTSTKHVLFEYEKELFMIPVERIKTSGRSNFNSSGEKTIDQTLYFPHVLMKMYSISSRIQK